VRVAIAALGTRGDILPYVVLGRGLREAGHDVLVSTMKRYRGLVENASLRFHALPGDPADVFHAGRIDVSPWRPLHHLSMVHAAVDALVSQADPELLLRAWRDREYVIFTGSTTFAHPVATHVGARCAMVVMTPTAATGAFAHPVLTPRLALGKRGNLASWLVGERLQKQTFKEPLKPAARRTWGLPVFPLATRRRGSAWPPIPLLHAYSPEVVPRPDDWPGHVTVTGWLLPDPSSEPLPDRVEQFLGQGPPPIYIGFGSMLIPDPERVAQMLAATLSRTRQRAIVCGASLAHASAFHGINAVLTAEELPHERLLHRVSAVVHHGGSGTTGASLRSSRPTLVTPFVFDQFFWGRRVRDLGAGPAPIPFRSLSGHRLAHALADLTSGRYDAAARRIGERIRAEHSTTRAIEEIHRVTDVEPRSGRPTSGTQLPSRSASHSAVQGAVGGKRDTSPEARGSSHGRPPSEEGRLPQVEDRSTP
jgi:sterol 3beta-glucosyltransferase